jgi:hypothetical protein
VGQNLIEITEGGRQQTKKIEKQKQKSLLQNWFFCHPERSEGSQASENSRFFATLRMTMVVNGEFCKSLKRKKLPTTHYPLPTINYLY